MNYVVVGLNHKTAPVALREKLAMPPERVRATLQDILAEPLIKESAVLSTCNRVEIYGVAPDASLARDSISRCFGAALSIPNPPSSLYAMTDREAVKHLFGVTASLDSLVVGENQIAKQVREAHEFAVASQATGPYLNRLFNRALFVAKRVKTETGIGKGNVSVGSVGVQLARKIFGSLNGRSVLLLGAGEIGELVLRHLRETDTPGETIIVNRSREKAAQLESQGLGTARDWADLGVTLESADILITSLSAGYEFMNRKFFAELMRRRGNASLFIIDLGVPRNVANDVGTLDNLFLYDIDDLKAVTEENGARRHGEITTAQSIIEEETRVFFEDHIGRRALPAITGLSKKFEDIRRAELEKTLAKMPHLSESDRSSVAYLTRAIVAKMLHDPILNLKSREELSGSTVLSVVRRIFSIEDEEES